MPFSVVTVVTEFGDKVELALPLDVSSRELATKIVRDLGKTIRPSDTFALYIDTGRGEKLIPAGVTLGALGIVDGQRLHLKREARPGTGPMPRAHAYLRTVSGDLLPLGSDNVILGRKDASSQTPLDLDLAAHDPSHAVSRRHAAIGREGASYYLVDLNSTNGTRLNAEPVVPGKKAALQDGDTIEFGLGMRVTFVVAKPTDG